MKEPPARGAPQHLMTIKNGSTVPFLSSYTRRYARSLTSRQVQRIERPAHLAIYASMR